MQSEVTESQLPSEFQALPTYTQTIRSNDSWVVGTITKTYPDGTVSQVSTIVPKR